MRGTNAASHVIALCFSAAVVPGPALAITAKDVMEKMPDKEQYRYITGLVDMLSYQALISGNRPKAECISNAFYSKKEETWRQLFDTFSRFPDKPPEGLLVVLMNRACGG